MVAARRAPATASAAPVASTAITKARKPKKKKLHLRTRELVRFKCQNLELDIMNLRQEIATLERTRQLLYTRTLNRADDFGGSVLKTIEHFYQLLRHGFNDVVWLGDERPLDFRQFIRVAFEEALAVGPHAVERDPHGRDQLVMRLSHMTALTGAPNVQMLDVQIQPARDGRTATVVVETVCTAPLSVLMLEAKFGHVSLFPELKNKLVGRRIAAYGTARYVFDTRSGRIIHADIQADHAAAILEVVDTDEEYEILCHGESRRVVAELVASEMSETSQESPQVSDAETVDILTVKEQTDAQRRATRATMSLGFLLSPDTVAA